MSDDESSSKPTGPMVTTSIILDGSYFFLALYNKLEGQWKKKSSLEKHKNQYFDGYEFVNFFMENIKIFMRELIVSFKMQSNVNDKDRKCKVFMTKGSKTSWRNNVLGDYKHSISPKIMPLLDIIYKDNIGLDDIEIYQNFNLESDDCIAILVNKLLDKNPDMFIHIISKNKRLIQLETEKVSIVDINKKSLREQTEVLSSSVLFSPNKFLFFLILKGDEDHCLPRVFYEEKTDIEYDNYYDNNDLIAEECEDIILAERLRNNYLICDYNSIPKKLVINFVKNNSRII
jgi:5'-3' exonuclease